MLVVGKEVLTNGGFDIVGLRVEFPEIVGTLEIVGESDVELEVGSVVVGFLLSVGSVDTLPDGAIDGCVVVVGDNVPFIVDEALGDNVVPFVEGAVGDNVVPFVVERVGAPVGALVSSPPGKTIWLVQYRSSNDPPSPAFR